MKKYLYTIITILCFSSCSQENSIPEDPINYDALNEIEIQDYIKKNNLDPTKSDSGLYYIIKNEGTGDFPQATSNVKTYYKGYLTNGSVFDESPTEGIDFDLNILIKGFSEGVTYLKEGGEITMIIPSKLAYPIELFPHNSFAGKVLIFDVKLISIN
ncbi:FKBP-type peptidyl-prolyl cis-trans isomerase [Polaribacter porphyrae]|uniref:Peptidyl-prolyl cis-trans isomerase n=1 Tax=Polaribacter porphyrae TaxID=1137780 RepID=A0A2S7WPB4_9FLAO|nr:FKBP-type peptidyl-prolyl cis-trans isomerase [Polaribacter porphyrae]PQJ79296.1 hypothetical protein BTO18_08980 [Polaribacter porphyrae]